MVPLLAFAALAAAPAPAPAEAPASLAGTWDLIWQTRHGPDRQGYLVVTQQGRSVVAQIHGRGSVKAKGEVAGATFILRGSRMAVPYTISGRIMGARIEGSLRILSIERRFTGTRRN